MSETKLIPTITELIVAGSGISIKTSYFEDTLPDTISAAISESSGMQDGISYVEGELLIQTKNNPQNIFYTLNSDGNLILNITTGDETSYSINSNGDLTYTTIV